MGYISPADRHQGVLLNSLDQAVAPDHVIRLVDQLIDSIVEADPDFFLDRGKSPEGRPAYHPKVFLKLYIYGALNGISSSRKLERACRVNLEVMWLLGRLAPNFKTISDYRKDQGDQIKAVFLRVNHFLKAQGLIKGKISSLDGSKVRAYASQSVSRESLDKLLVEDKQMLEKYLAALELADDQAKDEDPDDPWTGLGVSPEEITLMGAMEESKERIDLAEELLAKAQDHEQARINTTDPDARLMKGRGGKHWSYNLQSQVDHAHGLISEIEATSTCVDRPELVPSTKRLFERMGIAPDLLLGDMGYSRLQDILALEKGEVPGLPAIECFIPLQKTFQQKRQEKHGIAFSYDPELDQYTCTQGKELKNTGTQRVDNRRGTKARVYQADDCRCCPLKPHCAPKAKVARSIYRFSDQHIRDAYKQKITSPEAKRWRTLRFALSEHPFGTLKYWMGQIPLWLRGKEKVNTEVKIYATAYNILRSANILSVQEIIKRAKEYDWKADIGHIAQTFLASWTTLTTKYAYHRADRKLESYFLSLCNNSAGRFL
jgi:transposase